MSFVIEEKGRGVRERSPSFPFIPLKTAIERLVAFEDHHRRSPVSPERIGPSWNMKPNTSQAQQTLAALKAFGLLETQKTPNGNLIVISEDGRTYLRAQQDSVKEEVLRRIALKPKLIAFYWRQWGIERPKDAACLDELMFQGGFVLDGAERFLKVYDATIGYAGLAYSDNSEEEDERELSVDEEPDEAITDVRNTPNPLFVKQNRAPIMAGERELTSGLLSRGTSFRLIVNGIIGVKEIERLIQKLEIDKEILADSEDEDGEITEENLHKFV